MTSPDNKFPGREVIYLDTYKDRDMLCFNLYYQIERNVFRFYGVVSTYSELTVSGTVEHCTKKGPVVVFTGTIREKLPKLEPLTLTEIQKNILDFLIPHTEMAYIIFNRLS